MVVCGVNSEVGMSLGAGLKSDAADNLNGRRRTTPVVAAVVSIALTTVLLWQIDAQLDHEHLIFIYFLPTALVAIRYGSISAMGVIIASSLAAAYFLYGPPFSFEVGNKLELMELVLFGMLALLASQVVSGFANDSDVEKRRSRVRAVSTAGRWWDLKALLRRLRLKP
jgi:K+-sensing histidine kinase KdpD